MSQKRAEQTQRGWGRCFWSSWQPRAQSGPGEGEASPDEPPPLDRIPLHKFTSVRRTMSEVGGPVEDLIAKGPVSKYAQGVPIATGGPVPEVLKNYLDVSTGDPPSGRGPGCHEH